MAPHSTPHRAYGVRILETGILETIGQGHHLDEFGHIKIRSTETLSPESEIDISELSSSRGVQNQPSLPPSP